MEQSSANQVTVPQPMSMNLGDKDLISLAREIAMGVRDIEDILATLKISDERYDQIAAMPRFQGYLKSALEDWESASNTGERVKIKSLAFIEEALPEFYARVHDPKESLAAKTEALKAVARFAGLGGPVTSSGNDAGRMTVTINLGSDQQLRIERDITPTVEVEYETEEEDRL